MYDYGARMYMPDIGRWGVVDPLAEVHPEMTPFRYSFNNPINVTDPTGMLEDWYENENGDMVFDDAVKSQKDLTDKGIEGTYKYESGQEGDLAYAADGYVYDNSSAGGGLPIENGRTGNIEEVALKWNPSTARKGWNYLADIIISKPIEGVQVVGFIFYGGYVFTKQLATEGKVKSVEMDIPVRGFKNGLWQTNVYKNDMPESEKYDAFVKPGVDAMTFGVGTKVQLVKNPLLNVAVKMGLKNGTKELIKKSVKD